MLVIYKPIGLSPLEHINKLKSNEKIKSKKVSYAGRLDPMAHGLMIYLLEEECKLQENYINLNKTYSKKFNTEYMIMDDVHKYIKVVHFTGVGKTIHQSNAKFIKDNWNVR